MIMYMVEVKNVKNIATNKITYFRLVCGGVAAYQQSKIL